MDAAPILPVQYKFLPHCILPAAVSLSRDDTKNEYVIPGFDPESITLTTPLDSDFHQNDMGSGFPIGVGKGINTA